MASNYMFVDNPDFVLPALQYEPMKTYGFKKVTKDELETILERLQRKTFNAELYFGERFQLVPSPPRPPSTVCKRLVCHNRKEEEVPHGVHHHPPALSSKNLEQLLHRLRTPTASKLADSESNAKRESHPRRSRRRYESAEKEQEVLAQLSRPTTASRDKLVLRYAADPVVLSYNQRNTTSRNDDRPISRQEQDVLIERMQMDTVASRGGRLPFCKRMPSAWKQRLASTAEVYA